MQQVDYMEVAEKAIKEIDKGAFLTVLSEKLENGIEDRINTMTIGWAMIGKIWFKPVLMVAVRESRHTFQLIEKSPDFTVSVPMTNMKKATAFCGTKSGRDFDKFKECDLETVESQKVKSPVINTPGIHFECKIVYKSAMDPAFLDQGIDTKYYSDKDYHTLYFGDILNCYETE